MVHYWIAGLLLGYLTALSSAYLGRQPARGLDRDTRSLNAQITLNLVIALASSFAAIELRLRPGAALMAGLGWIAGLAIIATVAFRSGTLLYTAGPLERLGRLWLHFFVLPVGGLASRIVEKTSGHAASSLEESSARELSVLFSPEPISVLHREPLASVVREFARTTAEDIMVPRSAMVAVASSITLAQCVEVFAAKKFSRLPVYEGDTESVIGIVHVMDLLRETRLDKSVWQIVRPVLMVPQSKRCDELLKEFQKSQGYMAIVLDEYGGIAGLVTVEDLLEELVGEMGHEPLLLRRTVRRVAEGEFEVHAQIEVEKFEATTGVKIPRGDYETLAGYLLEEFGRIPEVGATLLKNRVLFEVLQADARKIKLIRVSVQGTSRSGRE